MELADKSAQWAFGEAMWYGEMVNNITKSFPGGSVNGCGCFDEISASSESYKTRKMQNWVCECG
jgi:hypothetical protein